MAGDVPTRNVPTRRGDSGTAVGSGPVAGAVDDGADEVPIGGSGTANVTTAEKCTRVPVTASHDG